MKAIAKAIAAVGLTAIGMWGYTVDIEHSGWLIGIGLLCLLDADDLK
jgi:preprotein translocase subunit Sss1